MHIYRSASTSMLKHASFFVGESTAADWLLARQCSAALYITQHRATIIIIIINATWEHVGSSQAQSARRKPLSLGRTSAPKPREPESASNDRTQVQSGIVVPQPKGTWVQHNQSTSLGAVTRRSVSSCCAVASPSCGKVFQDSWSRGEAVRKAKPKLPKALLGGRQPFHEPKFADFFRRLSPNQPEIGIVRAFLSHQAWLVCSLAVSRTSKPSPMPIRRSRPHAVPLGRLQLHWERATKAVHQIPRSKTPQDHPCQERRQVCQERAMA